MEIDTQYERAYAGVKDPLGKDFEGWDEEGVWPHERTLRALDDLLEDDEAEQQDTFAFLKEALDQDPPSNRKLFSF